MEILPEETNKIQFGKYRAKIAEWCPFASRVVYYHNYWYDFFADAINSLEWSDYKNLISTLLRSKETPIILVILDKVVLPSSIGENYTDTWFSQMKRYWQATEKYNKEVNSFRAEQQGEYEEACRRYKKEYFSNLAKYNLKFTEGTYTIDEYNKKEDNAHKSFTNLCTEEYHQMNIRVNQFEQEEMLKRFSVWKEVQDYLVNWLLAALI
ncbi:MAG: hypothetical protein WC476_00935 [Phycisphaerae bacterium]